MSSGAISKSQLSSLLQQHIYTEVGRYRGRIWQWDVCNEFLTDSNPSGINPNDFWIANLGPGVIANAFRWARQADPNVLLFYNDYNIGGEDGSNAKADAAYALAKQLLDQHVPIDGDRHPGAPGHPVRLEPAAAAAGHRAVRQPRPQVAITEADVRTFVDGATAQVPTDNLALFAQPFEFSEMLKAGLAVPELISFTVWGFTDADSWVPGFFTGEGCHHLRRQPQPQARLLRTAVRSRHRRARRTAPGTDVLAARLTPSLPYGGRPWPAAARRHAGRGAAPGSLPFAPGGCGAGRRSRRTVQGDGSFSVATL